MKAIVHHIQMTTALEQARQDLQKALAKYEATGDHNHGSRSLKPGEPCPGGDCLVARTRAALAALS